MTLLCQTAVLPYCAKYVFVARVTVLPGNVRIARQCTVCKCVGVTRVLDIQNVTLKEIMYWFRVQLYCLALSVLPGIVHIARQCAECNELLFLQTKRKPKEN